jgi:hypothetical protein
VTNSAQSWRERVRQIVDIVDRGRRAEPQPKASQPAPSSAVTTSSPSDSRKPYFLTATRVHDADIDRAAALAALNLERVQDQVRVRHPVARPGAEVLDDASSDLARRETWLFDIRSTPRRYTSVYARRVETPAR